LPAAMQNDPSDATGSDSAGLPEEHRSTVPACPVRILVRESDHPGGTELARRSPAPASKHAATHNHAPRGRVTGSQRTPNRRSARPGRTRDHPRTRSDWETPAPRWSCRLRPVLPAFAAAAVQDRRRRPTCRPRQSGSVLAYVGRRVPVSSAPFTGWDERHRCSANLSTRWQRGARVGGPEIGIASNCWSASQRNCSRTGSPLRRCGAKIEVSVPDPRTTWPPSTARSNATSGLLAAISPSERCGRRLIEHTFVNVGRFANTG
jgi:hypothetical protein